MSLVLDWVLLSFSVLLTIAAAAGAYSAGRSLASGAPLEITAYHVGAFPTSWQPGPIGKACLTIACMGFAALGVRGIAGAIRIQSPDELGCITALHRAAGAWGPHVDDRAQRQGLVAEPGSYGMVVLLAEGRQITEPTPAQMTIEHAFHVFRYLSDGAMKFAERPERGRADLQHAIEWAARVTNRMLKNVSARNQIGI